MHFWLQSGSDLSAAKFRQALLSVQALLLTLDLGLEVFQKQSSMRQPSRSTKLSKPPDLSARHPEHQPPRSRRQHNCQCFVLLGLLLLGLLPCSSGAHVHVNKQMRDHIQQVGVLSFDVPDTSPYALATSLLQRTGLAIRPPCVFIAVTPHCCHPTR